MGSLRFCQKTKLNKNTQKLTPTHPLPILYIRIVIKHQVLRSNEKENIYHNILIDNNDL